MTTNGNQDPFLVHLANRRFDPLDVHRERLLAARVEAQEMQNAVVAGTLISRQAVEEKLGDIIARARMIFLAFPGKVGAEIAAEVGCDVEKILPILRREVIAVLQILSKQEADEADRVSRAIKSGLEKGTNDAAEPQADGARAPARRRAVAKHDPAASRKRRGSRGKNAAGSLHDTLRAGLHTPPAAEPAPRPVKPARRSGRPVGSTV